MIHIKYLLGFLLLVATTGFAQEGTLKGILLDNDGQPLPGAYIQVKGTRNGVQTNFDGEYSINCEVGDILVITYVGYTTREVEVTAAMFKNSDLEVSAMRVAVKPIKNKAYEQALKRSNPSFKSIQNLDSSPLTYKVNREYFNFNQIKDISRNDSIIKIETYADNAFFEIALSQRSGFQYVPERNLPLTQKSFAQGRPADGDLVYRGPETGEFFSYGPLLNTLVYDDSNYRYDVNGMAVPQGMGSGKSVAPYASSLFNTGFNTSTTLKLAAFYDVYQLDIDFANGNQKDLFDQDKQVYNRFNIGFQNNKNPIKYTLQTGLSSSKTGNANINALHNQVYFSNLITPPSFSNNQGNRFDDSTQRSFSPGNYNNPYWLLQNNHNQLKQQAFNFQGNASYVGAQFRLNLKAHFDSAKEEQEVGLPPGTAGFSQGFSSFKRFENQNLNTEARASWTDLEITDFLIFSPSSTFQYAYSTLDFDFQEAGNNTRERNEDINKSTFQFLNNLQADANFDDFDLSLSLQHKLFTSSLQGSKLWLPDVTLNAKLGQLFYSNFLRTLNVSIAYSKNVRDQSLYFQNYGYNSVNLQLARSQQYTTNADLFNNSGLSLEEISGFDFSLGVQLWNRVELGFNYYSTRTENAIFPVMQANNWQLQNTATLRDRGFEASIELNTGSNYYDSADFNYTTAISFSTRNPVVLNLGRTGADRIPVAGFEEISQNLIAGQPVGVLYGSAYLRDAQGNLQIGADGFPIADPEPQILGDPIPDFNLGWTNTFRFGKLLLNFKLDWQQGGDVWNGTQQVLNYFGTSQESAQNRGITNYVFDGIATDGSPNTQAVAFASRNAPVDTNLWVRYGYAGVAEANLEDASFLNLQNVSLTYQFQRHSENFFRDLSISIYGHNLWNSTGYRGANPYGSLFGNLAGNALNYFNMPLAAEVGLQLNFKI